MKRVKPSLCLFVCCHVLLVFGLVRFVSADTIKLKDGTVLEGEIKAEDDQQISIEVKLAGGSILQTETVNKTNIVELTRLTPEQKADRERVEIAHANTARYRLDYDNSYPLEYYDQVINDVFHGFLARFPNSPYEKEINDKITQWKAERDLVAGGKTKYRGQWMADSVIEQLSEQDRVSRKLQEGRTRLALGLYKEAIQKFRAVATVTAQPGPIAEARKLELQAANLWLQSLERQRQQISRDIQTYESQAAHARETNAESYRLAAEKHLTELRAQLDDVQQRIADVRSLATAAAAPPPAPSATTAAPAPTPTAVPEALPESEHTPWFDILYTLVAWFKKGWGIVAGILIVLLVVISRKMGR